MPDPFPRTFFLKLTIKVSAEEEHWIGMVDRDYRDRMFRQDAEVRYDNKPVTEQRE
jgi:hypothetical protein